MKLIALLGGAACALTISAGAASAATYSTEFATFCSYVCDGTTPYSDGGVTVQYIGAPGQIWTTSQPTAPSGYSWYPDGGSTGYTDITLTGGGTFSLAQLLVGSGWYGGGGQLDYQLLDGATVVASGDWGTVPAYTGFVTATLPSGIFTELQIQAPQSATFSPLNYEALAIGSITLSNVPEPATWAVMLIGLGLVGGMLRRDARTGREARTALIVAAG